MANMKKRINFNKVRNKTEKIKTKIKNEKEDLEKKVTSKKPKKVKKEKLPKEKKHKNKRRIFYYILSFITFCAIMVILALIAFAAYIVIKAPEFNEDKLFNKESTIIFDINGNKLTTLGMDVGGDNVETRIKLSYDEMPQVLVDAVVATEDSRFFIHNGVDLVRFLKASIGQVLGQSGAGGASTLTMQVSKNSLTGKESSGWDGIVRKFTDVYLSVFKIEKAYTKEEIFELYVNSSYLGGSSYGVEQASQTYFGKSARDLSLTEAALIAGLFQAPNGYDPYVYPEKALARRNQVLNLMKRHGYISEEQCEAAKSIPIENMLKEKQADTNDAQSYIDTVVEELENEYGLNAYTTSLEIYTNYDPAKQAVINSIYNGTAGFEFKDEKINLAVAVVDNKTGALIAVGAGRNKLGARTFNWATQNITHPGSTIKPILDYGPAFEYLNWSTAEPLFDEPTTYSGGVMGNWNNKYSGMVTAKTALSESMNTGAIQTFRKTTMEQKWNFATGLGVTPCEKETQECNGQIYESLAIGAANVVTPVQLASAYSAFASGGYYTKAYTINKIKYIDTGEEIAHEHTRTRAMKETTAYLITNILFNVTTSSAQVKGNQIASKTGTSSWSEEAKRKKGIKGDIIKDAWVATYNPDYTITFWYGYDQLYSDYYILNSRSTPDRNKIHSILAHNILNTGSQFTVPSNIIPVKIELETIPVKLPSEFTPGDIIQTHYFVKGTEPTEVSTRYSKLENPTNVKISETGAKAVVTWDSPKIPDAVNDDYLRNYFTTYYGEWSEQYYQKRINYNSVVIGSFGFDIYLKSGSNLTYVGHTSDTTYTINNTTNYDSIVIKSAYSIFKNNASTGVEVTINGTGDNSGSGPSGGGGSSSGGTTSGSKTPTIELQAMKVGSDYYLNPTYNIGDTIPDFGLKTIKFVVNGKDIISQIDASSKSYVIKECSDTCQTVTDIDTTKAGNYEIVYTINYLGTPYQKTRSIHIK